MTVRDTVRGDQVVWEHAGAAFKEESRSYPAQMGREREHGGCGLDVNPARDGPQTVARRTAREGSPR